jgi:hypothetical protein
VGATFSDTHYHDYIKHCDKDGFDLMQDRHSGKGYLNATVTLDHKFDSAIQGDVAFGLVGTHMITSQGKYPLSAKACFQSLVAKLQDFANANQPALLLSDLNSTESGNPPSFKPDGSPAHASAEFSIFVNGVLLNFPGGAANSPVTISEAYTESRTIGLGLTPVTCYSYANRYTYAQGNAPAIGDWQEACVPFYIPADGTGQVPVYDYQREFSDGTHDRFSTNPDLASTDPSMAGWTRLTAFNAVQASSQANPAAAPIYEWTCQSTVDGANVTLYGYFPEGTVMPDGWTMGNLAFYAYNLLLIDPGYTVDSSTNSFWALVNAPGGQTPANPTKQRIDYIFHTTPANAPTTIEVLYAGVLTALPELRVNGSEDISDHFPLFAVL